MWPGQPMKLNNIKCYSAFKKKTCYSINKSLRHGTNAALANFPVINQFEFSS